MKEYVNVSSFVLASTFVFSISTEMFTHDA